MLWGTQAHSFAQILSLQLQKSAGRVGGNPNSNFCQKGAPRAARGHPQHQALVPCGGGTLGGREARPLGKNLNWDSRPPRWRISAIEGSNFAENCMLGFPKVLHFGLSARNALIWRPLARPLGWASGAPSGAGTGVPMRLGRPGERQSKPGGRLGRASCRPECLGKEVAL